VNSDGPRFSVGHCSHRGQQRELNEDSYLVLTAPAVTHEIDGLLAVADGMGGHRAGDVASRMLAETLDRFFTTDAYREPVAYSPRHSDYYLVVLKEAIERINESIYEEAASRRDLQGMGTTATVALLTGWRLFLGHVGDSRAYLLREGNLQQLTHDQTWVAEQVRGGQLTPQEAAQHPRRSELLQSLGNSPLVRVERSIHTLRPDDTLLLCSDGLSSLVHDSETKEIITHILDPQRAAEKLVTLANRRGGPDNITALVVQLTADGAPSNIAGGRVLGPLPQINAEEVAADTLKLKRSGHRGQTFVKQLAWPLCVALVLMPAGLLSGLVAWFLPMIPSAGRLPASTVVTVTAFILGALLGGLLRSSWIKQGSAGASEDVSRSRSQGGAKI
jgi:protein phosphatase